MDLLLVIPLHEYGGGGILSGFLHPLLGLDHLLAMIAVGLLSAQMGGRAIWTVPTTFVAVMAVGGILGIQGIALPWVEYGITGSVLALGIAILMGGKTPLQLAMLFVALFGLFHGNAHGTELPNATDTMALTIAYVAGFLIATVGLHLIGALLGMIAERKTQGIMIVRLSGALLSVIGILLVLRV
ncbi:HupE/UreJ family protein [Chloroflexi bacterium TSY]|nr:HupE/UreJ family protein [Chloroflexi bacterium TSY]